MGEYAYSNYACMQFSLINICNLYIMLLCYKDTPLPVAWLSIEALRHLRFSIQPDVWAFGVFMWEVFTMGETPYIGINLGPEFVQYLEDGHRLEIPEQATKEM